MPPQLLELARPAACQTRTWELAFAPEVAPLALEAPDEPALHIACAGDGARWILEFPPAATTPNDASPTVRLAVIGGPARLVRFAPCARPAPPPASRTPWEAHVARERASHELPSPLREHHAFFTALQAATEPSLLESAPADRPCLRARATLAADLRNVHGLVRRALFQRVRATLAAASGCARATASPAVGFAPAEARRIARLAIRLFEDPELGAWSRVPLETFGRAFEHFALGDLRVDAHDRARNAEPNSGYFFLFAEFAFAAAAVLGARRGPQDPRVQRWRRQAALLVQAEHLYLFAYRPRDPFHPAFGSYDPGTHDPHARERLAPGAIPSLRRTYGTLDVDDANAWAELQERHALLAAQGLSDWAPGARRWRHELVRAQRTRSGPPRADVRCETDAPPPGTRPAAESSVP